MIFTANIPKGYNEAWLPVNSTHGMTGNDYIKGGSGFDNISGGHGADYIDGGLGTDFLWGGVGYDTINGGPSGSNSAPNGDLCADIEPLSDTATSCERTLSSDPGWSAQMPWRVAPNPAHQGCGGFSEFSASSSTFQLGRGSGGVNSFICPGWGSIR